MSERSVLARPGHRGRARARQAGGATIVSQFFSGCYGDLGRTRSPESICPELTPAEQRCYVPPGWATAWSYNGPVQIPALLTDIVAKPFPSDRGPTYVSKTKRQCAGSLVVVESPAKAKTIAKYLGDSYTVKACMGHVRDLPKRDFGIDLARGFEPTYEILPGRKRVVNELSRAAKGADAVYLATDLDREGEAIAWHLVTALDLPAEKLRRVIFNQITASAIREAFANPHGIDMDKVNAQQARRILDRIVGYELSPLLWRKIAKGLSAGRVQSVAVRLIVEREAQIRSFVPEESWRITAYFAARPDEAGRLAGEWDELLARRDDRDNGPTLRDRLKWLAEHECFQAELVNLGGTEFKPTTPAEARQAAEALGFVCEQVKESAWQEYAHHGLKIVKLLGRTKPEQGPKFKIRGIETKRALSKPPAPFTTATLQQAAANQLRFSASRTMRVAQELYEGVDLGGELGSVGLISYMRTDSTHLSKEAVENGRHLIRSQFGESYLPSRPNLYGNSKRAQEAHEAIRPTDVAIRPETISDRLTKDQLRLYDLIWRRFLACQMRPAEWDNTVVQLSAQTQLGEAVLRASGRRLVFDGFMKVAGVPDSATEQQLPSLAVDQQVGALTIEPAQRFTSPPPRYTEASLVKALEAEGIGRPSTYAAIIDTIQERGYVEQTDRRFHATALGETVTVKLVEHFPKIMDVKFTAFMEDELDKIEEAHKDWGVVLHEFYDPFHEALMQASEQMEPIKAEPSEYQCERCGKPMVYRWSKGGRYLACTGYPKCNTTYNADRDGKPILPRVTAHKCEQCGKPMLFRQSRRGPFLGCSGYPDCDFVLPCDAEGNPLKLVREEDVKQSCELCGAPMVVRRRGHRAFLGCSGYPKCTNTTSLPEGVRLESKPKPPPEPTGFNCEKCGKPMVIRDGRRGRFISCDGFPKCRNTYPVERLEELRGQAQQPATHETPGPNAGSGAGKAKEAKSSKRAAKPRAKSSKKPEAKAAGASAVSINENGKLVVESLAESVRCPKCGELMALKRGRFGPFLSCSGFPKCRTTGRLKGQAVKQAEAELGEPPAKPKPEPTDIQCEQCGANMLIRSGRRGRFLGCSKFPTCRNTKPLPPQLIASPSNS